MFKHFKSNRFMFISAVLLVFVAACGTIAGERSVTVFSDEAAFGSEPAYAPMAQESFDKAMVDDMSLAIMQTGGDGFIEEEMVRSQERIVIKNGDLTIAVEDPAKTMDEISKMAEEFGGFVTSSNLYQAYLENGLQVPQGNITIRVPSERFIETLELIENSANQVISRNQSGQDVTREYTDLNSRLVNLDRTELQLRQIMESATKTEDVLRVYNELSRIRGEIEMVKGNIKYFEESAALSSINVTLLADEAVQPLTIGGWQPGGVAKDAIQSLINSLQFLANFAIRLTLLYVPVLLVVAVPIWLVLRTLKRRTKASDISAKQEKPSKK